VIVIYMHVNIVFVWWNCKKWYHCQSI